MNINTETLPAALLSTVLLLLTLSPLLTTITPLLPKPHPLSFATFLLALFDHLSSAFFAARYLTFSTGLPPTHPQNLYPYLLPYLPLLQISKALFSNPITETILPYSGTPAPVYNPCQANFSIFLGTVLAIPLTILQIFYGVPSGISHWVGLTLPALLIVKREECSLLTVFWLALIAWQGNPPVLVYLLFHAVLALKNNVSLARILLAKSGDWPVENQGDAVAEAQGEEKPLLSKIVEHCSIGEE